MLLKYRVILIVLIFTHNIYSQSDFRKGYIITNDIDTVHGLIDYGNPFRNSEACYFKNDSLSEVRKYSPKDINAFVIVDKHFYISKTIPLKNEDIKIFAEYLLNGIVNLYFYRSSSGSDHYYVEKEGRLYELTNAEKIRDRDGVEYSRNSNQYIGVLSYLMQDANNLQKDFQKTQFNHESLIETTKKYHDVICDGESCIVYYKKDKKINTARWKFRFGFSAEYVWSNVNMTNQSSFGTITHNGNEFFDLYEIEETNANQKVAKNFFVPGVFMNINRNRRASLQLEFKYHQMEDISFELKEMKVPILLNYDLLLHKKTIPFLTCGLDLHYLLDAKFYDLKIIYNRLDGFNLNKPVYSAHQSELFYDGDSNKITGGISLGGGVRYFLKNSNYIKIEARFSSNKRYYNFSFSDNNAEFKMKSNSSNIAAIVSYAF